MFEGKKPLLSDEFLDELAKEINEEFGWDNEIEGRNIEIESNTKQSKEDME
ncbi:MULTISPECIES: hypothetical protein [Neobacillus]|jgi:hypothetical protein|uniref:hypothetical protein n=1 Tax=Neobacillus TaxID=2675232 RepID=UPI000ACE2C84|nr:hypothetical protein [Neobacillus sedimentimangrovi]